MKKHQMLSVLMLLAGITMSGATLADHHRHGGVGFYFGVPFPHPYYAFPYYYPYPYSYPYAYYPPVVAAPEQPPVYIEQNNVQSAPQQPPVPQATSYWYHCNDPEGYYPYLKECPAGWQKVTPTPPPSQ